MGLDSLLDMLPGVQPGLVVNGQRPLVFQADPARDDFLDMLPTRFSIKIQFVVQETPSLIASAPRGSRRRWVLM